MPKWIKVKNTGTVTTVSDEYFATYEKDGWFLEVSDPTPKPKAAPKKVAPKE